MQIAAMFLGCLLAGQAPDVLLSPPTGQEKRSPAILDPEIRAATATSEVSPAASAPASNQAGGRPA